MDYSVFHHRLMRYLEMTVMANRSLVRGLSVNLSMTTTNTKTPIDHIPTKHDEDKYTVYHAHPEN